EELRRRAMLFDDPDLQRYLESVGRKAVLAAAAANTHFRFGVIREPTINAFAWPHGAVYVHAGLLARLENEAQLAHVLGHEVTHTIQRHQLKFIRSVQNKTVAVKIADLVLTPAAIAFGGGLG